MSESLCDRHRYSPGTSIKTCGCGSVKAVVSPWKSNATQLLLQAALWCQVIKQSAFIPRKSKEFLEWLHLSLTNSLWYILFFYYKISTGLESLLAWALNFIGNVLTSQYCNRKPGKGMKGENLYAEKLQELMSKAWLKNKQPSPPTSPLGTVCLLGTDDFVIHLVTVIPLTYKIVQR